MWLPATPGSQHFITIRSLDGVSLEYSLSYSKTLMASTCECLKSTMCLGFMVTEVLFPRHAKKQVLVYSKEGMRGMDV